MGQELNEKKEITVSLGVWNGKERNKKEKVVLGLQGSWLLPGGGGLLAIQRNLAT